MNPLPFCSKMATALRPVCRFALQLLGTLVTASTAIAGPVGFASLNGGTTGGAAGPTVVATTADQFRSFATQSGPLTIEVVGTLDVGGVRVESDKTIYGQGAHGGVIGSLQLSDVSNVIIRNLSISNPNDAGEGDAITLRESENIWIDHNNIFDAPDGLLDIVSQSDFVTVSWNKIYYTDDWANSNAHRFSMLIGNGDNVTADRGKLRVTMHDNHFGQHVQERMPRVRYGDVHVLNNYLNSPGSNYAVRAAVESEVLVENNVFQNIGDPYQTFSTSAGVGEIEARGNILRGSGNPSHPGTDDVFDPPYAYTAIDASLVEDRVLAGAGIANLPGDYNNDGVVDAADYTVWRDNVGAQDGALPNDADGGLIGQAQYDTWVEAFGATGPPDPPPGDGGGGVFNPFAVPEPTAASLLAFATACVLGRVRTGAVLAAAPRR